VPDYIKDDLSLGHNKEYSFQHMTSIKSGLKIGKKLGDGDNKWIEKWFEVCC